MPMFHHAYDSLTMPMFHHAKLSVPACPFLSYYVQDDIHSYSTLHVPLWSLTRCILHHPVAPHRAGSTGSSAGVGGHRRGSHRGVWAVAGRGRGGRPRPPQPPQDTPILFLSGAKDELMPPAHMRQLYAEAQRNTGGSSLFVEVAAGGHMDTWLRGGQRYWRVLSLFITHHAGGGVGGGVAEGEGERGGKEELIEELSEVVRESAGELTLRRVGDGAKMRTSHEGTGAHHMRAQAHIT
ncbi:unnamed protein product [Closterium sp. NIES-64]|nr:unnamed protein product [Closterium sp. NIES-64]